MGVYNKFWGPHFWIILHSIAASYSDKPSAIELSNMFNFMSSIENIVPCGQCKEHYQKLMLYGSKKNNIPPMTVKVLKNRKSLFKYIYNIHTFVNQYKPLEKGEKRKKPPSLKSVIEFYNTKLSIITPKMK